MIKPGPGWKPKTRILFYAGVFLLVVSVLSHVAWIRPASAEYSAEQGAGLVRALSPGYGEAAGILGLSAMFLLALRSLAPVLPQRKERKEETLIVGQPQALKELAGKDFHSHVVVVEKEARNHPELIKMLIDCKLRGLKVEGAIEFGERIHHKIWLDAVFPEWFVFCDGFRPSPIQLKFKRLADVLGALLLLTAAAPLLGLIAAAIKLTSPGPVLFKQRRVGQHGRLFTLYKFRSMRADAEQDTGPVWSSNDDPRVTVVGRLLRKFHLDEIPQAWNVLKGDLSFVGPRPERPFFVELLKEQIPYYDLRHYIRPGLSGWAQVNYEYGDSIEDSREKLQYDLYYLKNFSLTLDLLILARTAKRVLLGNGR